MVQSILIKDLKKILENINIIDIRSAVSYNNNHIPGAHNVPYEKLLSDPNKYLDRYKSYYIYCQKGKSSQNVCQILNRLGYRVINIAGGYESWILEN